jgi:hypothetical protein
MPVPRLDTASAGYLTGGTSNCAIAEPCNAGPLLQDGIESSDFVPAVKPEPHNQRPQAPSVGTRRTGGKATVREIRCHGCVAGR